MFRLICRHKNSVSVFHLQFKVLLFLPVYSLVRNHLTTINAHMCMKQYSDFSHHTAFLLVFSYFSHFTFFFNRLNFSLLYKDKKAPV